MALAGFVKHNIIAMPLTAFLWLGLHRRREAVKCFCVAAIAIMTVPQFVMPCSAGTSF